MRIFVARHGQTAWNLEHKMQGCLDSPLTEKGIENAKKLGESLENIDFDVIYCSPLKRAVDSANYVKGSKNTKLIINESFKEMNYGKWEGMTIDEVKEKYSLEYDNFINKPDKFEPIGGESYESLINRVKNGLFNIIDNSEGENILIVTHTAVIKAIILIAKNNPLEKFWNPPYITDTSLTVLEVVDGKIKLILEVDNSHLDRLESLNTI